MSKPTFGISIEPTWNQRYCIALARHAEHLGFSNIWVPDGGLVSPFSDTIVTLAGIASNTKKIKFGSAILNFYTRNPAQIASSFLALSNAGFADEEGPHAGSKSRRRRSEVARKQQRQSVQSLGLGWVQITMSQGLGSFREEPWLKTCAKQSNQFRSCLQEKKFRSEQIRLRLKE